MATHVFRLCSKAAGTPALLCRSSAAVLRGNHIFRSRLIPRPRLFATVLENDNGQPGNKLDEEKAIGNTQSNVPEIPENQFYGMSQEPFPSKVTDVLLAPIPSEDIEIKPDGLLYLPGIKYRRILNQAFGPGGWALIPRGEVNRFKSEVEGAQLVTREYALYCMGRFVSQTVGEHAFFGKGTLGYGKACESAKSNALTRCCKDLGIASELWDPQFINEWKKENAEEVWCVNARTKEKKKLWRKKGSSNSFTYPWQPQ